MGGVHNAPVQRRWASFGPADFAADVLFIMDNKNGRWHGGHPLFRERHPDTGSRWH